MEKKMKWTVIDTLIVLVVAAVVAVGALMFGPKLIGKSKSEKVTFVVMMQEKDIELAEAMKAGDKVTLSLAEKDGGIIKDVSYVPATRQTFSSMNGVYTDVPVENKVDLYVTVEADCIISETAAKTGDTAIKVGTDIPVRGKGFASSGYIITIDK